MGRINKESIDRFYDYDIYPETRTIYMGSIDNDIEYGESGTDGALAERMVKGLHVLDSSAKEGDKPITVLMNNPGGDVYHGMAIYDAIKTCKNHITIVVYGHAMSMGSLILQAADKRVMSPNSKIMIHYGYFGINDVPKSVQNWAEESKKINKWMEQTYLAKIKEKHPTFSLKKVQEMCNFDTIISAKDALELGLIDEILE